MLVDDDPNTSFIIKMPLQDHGFSVDTFAHAQKAYEAFKTNPYRYSAVLTQIEIPEINGISLAQLLLKIKPDLKIILLRKPFTASQIVAEVKKQLNVA